MTTDTLSQAFAPTAAAPAAKPPRTRRSGQLIRLASIAVLAAVFAYFSAAAPGFLALGNLTNVIEQSTVLALLAFGMSIVIIGGGGDVIRGGIDLSLGANLGLCAAVFTVASNAGLSDG